MTQPSGAVGYAMELSQLQSHIRALITLEEEEAPMVSCYVHRAIGRNGSGHPLLERRARAIRKVLAGQQLEDFEEAFDRIQRYLGMEVRPTTRGVATFARAGRRPFFLGLQFQVPLPHRLSANATADIFHLVKLKDSYHRYIVLISTEESARILEVNLGAITREVWVEQPELRERVGREWTQEQYQNRRRNRGDRFLKEKIELVEKLTAAAGHTHLILAGSPRVAARIRNCLPKHLQAKLIDVVPASANARVTDVVAATLSTFIDREQQESLDAVAELLSALRRGGLGAAGSAATVEALRRGQADVLVMAQAYESGPAWCCRDCGWADAMVSPPERCALCDSGEVRSANLKEIMIKLAERQSVEVELVQHSDLLMDLGGVGCLLRYAAPEQDRWA
ncbi:MAG: hypothetical protein EHM78_13010 [Myxococcaceae bacterium]|nr:MAG: hypothetical protein EHM78_13010 [Myxococcaceae bacterium]